MTPLSELQRDALAEIFNIGVGVAAAAVHELTGEHVPVSVPQVDLATQHEARDRLLALERRPLYAVRKLFYGEVSVEAVLLLPEESHPTLVRIMAGEELADEELGDVTDDAIGELGNIVLQAVMSNLASCLGMRFENTLPEVRVVEGAAVFDRQHVAPHDDDAPVLTLVMDFEVGARHVNGYLVFLLDAAANERLLQAVVRAVGDDTTV